jgi:hypothetical protein
MGKVFYSDGSGNARPDQPSVIPGWYYQIDMADPVGPFDTKPLARKAAASWSRANPPRVVMANRRP